MRIPSAKGNRAALEVIQRSLTELKGVNEVQINESIGSVTIHYDPRMHADLSQQLASGSTTQEVVSVQPPRIEDMKDMPDMLEKEAEFLSQHSDAAKAIVDWMKALDTSIKRVTGNSVDLKVVAPLALAVAVFAELGVAAATPVWLTLGLFSFNHFIELHSHPEAADPACPAPDAAGSNPPPMRRKTPRNP
jgi:hypothetical protein